MFIRINRQFVVALAVLAIFAVNTSHPLLAQVENDRIAGRIALKLDDSATISTTSHASVETNCINKPLTNACLVYHNDQWFTFSVPSDGRFYLNIGSQECLRKLGIQVLLIDGDPCKIDTYRVIQCLPRARLEDTYVVLDSLKRGVDYLLNIDGFLGDQCSFTIQLSSHPMGLPTTESLSKDFWGKVVLNDSIVALTIHTMATGTIKYRTFELYRSSPGSQSLELSGVPADYQNALGTVEDAVTYLDTLQAPGKFIYAVYGIDPLNGERKMLMKELVIYGGSPIYKSRFTVRLPVGHTKADRGWVRVINDPTGDVLDPALYTNITAGEAYVDLFRYIAAGYTNLILELTIEGKKKSALFFCRAEATGISLRSIDQ